MEGSTKQFATNELCIDLCTYLRIFHGYYFGFPLLCLKCKLDFRFIHFLPRLVKPSDFNLHLFKYTYPLSKFWFCTHMPLSLRTNELPLFIQNNETVCNLPVVNLGNDYVQRTFGRIRANIQLAHKVGFTTLSDAGKYTVIPD